MVRTSSSVDSTYSTGLNVREAYYNKPAKCIDCHAGTNHDSKHTVDVDTNCMECHKNSLTQEHINNTTTAGKNFDCNTCHASTVRAVKRTIASNRLNCTACHSAGHNVLFADSVPADIPLFPGFKWTTPMEAALFAGEPTTPTGFEEGQVVESNRRDNITSGEVWDFYNGQMMTNGWVLKSPLPAAGAQSFTGEFGKGSLSVTVKCYNGSANDETGLPVNLERRAFLCLNKIARMNTDEHG